MKKKKVNVMQSFAMVSQFGINMIVPIALCVALGVWIGDKYDMDWIVIPLFFMGALAGFTNIYRMAKDIIKKDSKKENDAKKN